jgi:hypothetical protein
MNTSNTLPESYQQRVDSNNLATVKRQIEQAENPTPAMVISMDGASVDNPMFLDYLTSEVELEESEIGHTDPNIPIDINCTDGNLRIRRSGGSGDTEDEGVEGGVCDAIPTASRCQRPETELERFDFGSSDLDWYEG